jgi:uncharacterized membrane protein YwaF
MGPWPVYILAGALLAAVLFLALAALARPISARPVIEHEAAGLRE